MTLGWRALVVVAVAAIAGWLVVRLGTGQNVDPAEVERDLAELSEALRLDQIIETHVLPERSQMPSIPSTMRYRRAVQFWQPAFAAAPKERP